MPMNTVQLIGRLTRPPDSHERTEGDLTTLRLAIPRPTDGEADFVTVVCFDQLAIAALAHLDKGDRVAVAGRLSHSEWTDTDGSHRERINVIARTVDFLTERPATTPAA